MKKVKYLLLFSLMLLPNVVFASSWNIAVSIGAAIGIEAFVSIHMSVFVLSPISKMINPDNSKKLFWILFIARAIFLLFMDFFVTPGIAIVDLIAVFVGAAIVVPITSKITKIPIHARSNQVIDSTTVGAINNSNNITSIPGAATGIVLKCAKCGGVLNVTDKFCQKCGTAFNGNNVQVIQDTSPIVPVDQKYLASEKYILINMIKDEIKLQGEDVSKFTTRSLNKKRNILLGIIGAFTLFNAILYFFNISLIKCLIFEIIALLIYKIISNRFNVLKKLTKQAISSPDMDISKLVNDVRTEKQEVILPGFLKIIIVAFVGIILPTIFFFNPRILYTKYDGGYQVFRYTRGITYNEEVIIPSTYKGNSVVSIGDNAFKNSNVKKVNLLYGLETIKAEAFNGCKKLEEIIIPTSVTEIRAEAFANCTNLKTVSLSEGLLTIRAGAFKNDINLINIKLPSTLEYLGASTFSHCSSLIEITIPKNVTEINGQTFEYCTSLQKITMHDDIISIHGEVFAGDVSLKNVTLPSKITEIRGNTFENCSSLTSIIIPYRVTRIGGHAFYGCSSLSYVSVPSTVTEIGSSAFRQCYSLKNIRIPYKAIVNERAFKESPTYVERY